DRERPKSPRPAHESELLGCGEGSVEVVMVHDALALEVEHQLTCMGLGNVLLPAKVPQERSEHRLVHSREWTVAAERLPRLIRTRATVLGHQRQDLLDECREMERAGRRRLEPPSGQKAH